MVSEIPEMHFCRYDLYLRQNEQKNHYPDIALPELPENVRQKLKAQIFLIPNRCPEKRESDVGI